jgi:hypothetical protein
MNLPINAIANEETCSGCPTGNSKLNAGKQANTATTIAIAAQALGEYKAVGAEDKDIVADGALVATLILRFSL